MILPARRGPDTRHLAQTCANAKIAEYGENEAVDECDGAAGRHDIAEDSCESDPGAVRRMQR